MSKEVTMTFRVESDLRTSFTEAAELDHRPAAQVLREFMRAYIDRVRKQSESSSTLSEAERIRREKAVSFARASVGLEGLPVSQEDEARARRFINGEIELSEFVKISNDSTQER